MYPYPGVNTRLLVEKEPALGISESETPLVFEARGPRDLSHLHSALTDHAQQIVSDAAQHGAVLMHGFEVETDQDFERTVVALRGMRGKRGIANAFMAERGRTVGRGDCAASWDSDSDAVACVVPCACEGHAKLHALDLGTGPGQLGRKFEDGGPPGAHVSSAFEHAEVELVARTMREHFASFARPRRQAFLSDFDQGSALCGSRHAGQEPDSFGERVSNGTDAWRIIAKTISFETGAQLQDIILSMLRRTARLPGMRQLERALRWRQFLEMPNSCWGVYRTFPEAQAQAPAGKPIGYDNPDAAAMYRHLLETVEPKDYAVAFWLQKHLRPGNRVFDFGGHVGVKYYAIRTVLDFPPDVTWTVLDVPAVIEQGRLLAKERPSPGLSFTHSFADASGVDVFLASGSLQYVETPLPDMLATLGERPKCVIVSESPMVDGERYVTLQNVKSMYCPYLVESRSMLKARLADLGYKLARSWENPEKVCRILDHLDRSVSGYTCMLFVLDSAGSRPEAN